MGWRASALVLGLGACAQGADAPARDDTGTPAAPTAPADTSPDPCDLHTWATAGAPFVRTWCSPCHAAALPRRARAGAPLGVDFDAAADVIRHAEAVRDRTLADSPSMPPGGGPTAAERTTFATWLTCALARSSGLDDP